MTTTGYLMIVTTSKQDTEILLAILNTAERGQAIYSISNESIKKELWIIPKRKKNKQEIIAQLNKVPGIFSISIVGLSKTLKETELLEVRELFNSIGWDASDVTDNDLSRFINAKLQGQYTYFVDYDHKKIGKQLLKIYIKPIEEHPDFSPDWLVKDDHKEDIPDRELTSDDIEIRQGIIQNGRRKLTKRNTDK